MTDGLRHRGAFAFLVEARRDEDQASNCCHPPRDLARALGRPLYNHHCSPDRELRAPVATGRHRKPAGDTIWTKKRSHGIAEIVPDGSVLGSNR